MKASTGEKTLQTRKIPLNEATKKGIICLFFLAFALLGFLTANDYGVPWDQPLEIDILKSNLVSYESHLLGEISPRFKYIEPITTSVERDHGLSGFYLFAPFLYMDGISDAQYSTIWHCVCWFIFTLGAIGLYGCLRSLTRSRPIALLGVLFLLLTPRFFAEGHYNNKDIALFSFTLLTLWQTFRLLERPRYSTLIAFSIFGAFAFNTKVVGVALFGICGIFVFLHSLRMAKKRNMKIWQIFAMVFTGIVVMLGVYFLITPAAWKNPFAYLGYLITNALQFSRWNGNVLYLGTVYNTANTVLPQSFLPVMLLFSTPLWMLLVMVVGQGFALAKKCTRKLSPTTWVQLLLTSTLFIVPLTFAVLTRTRVYNGWRHFYFLYAPLCVMAGYGLSCLLCAFKKKRVVQTMVAVVLVCCFAFNAVGIVLAHPYQYGYYQPLVQAVNENGKYVEMDYWNISARDALIALAKKTEGTLTIAGSDFWSDFALRFALPVLPDDVHKRINYYNQHRAWKAGYVLSNPTYVQFNQNVVDLSKMDELVAIKAYDIPLMHVYAKPDQK